MITEDARLKARERLEEAGLEAKRIVDAAGQERAKLLDELARERSVFEERRTRLSGYLADVLDKVESTTAASEGPASDGQLDEELGVRMSTGADH